MQPKTERFEMRLDEGMLERVDSWRGAQEGLPSRSEAIRRLIEAGVTPPTPRTQPKISDGEKLILIMLCQLYKHLEVESEIDPDFVQDAIHGGHYWGLRWKYTGIFHGHEDNEEILSEVVDILDMWDFLESGYAKLSKDDKAHVAKEAEPFGKPVRFPGFDGNSESEHLGVAGFLINKLERFSILKRRDLNSHMPTLWAYGPMLKVFHPIRRTLLGRELGVGEIVAILNARKQSKR